MRNFLVYLGEIIDAMEKIGSFTRDLSFEQFTCRLSSSRLMKRRSAPCGTN